MRKDGNFSLYALISLPTCLSTHSSPYFKKVMARKDGKKGWRGKMMTFFLTHLSPYALVSLRTHLLINSTPHYLCSQKVFLVMETICILSTCWEMRLSFLKRHWIAWNLSRQLDAIKYALFLYIRQPCYQYWSRLQARWQRLTFGMSLVRWQKSTFDMSSVLVRDD